MKRYYLLLLAMLFLNACIDDYQIGPSTNSDLSVEDAKALYESCLSSAMTKSDDGNAQPNYFERASAKVNWDEADAYSSGKASVVDAPSSSTNDYIALMHDGNGYFFSKCFHDIRVLQSKEDGSSTAYNHFLMPFRKDAKTAMAETPTDFNGPMMQEFSGLEIYSTIDGQVAAVNCYFEGVIFKSAFVGYGSYGDEWISYYLRSYIRKLYITGHCHHENETKAATRVFSCPKCGATLYDSAVGYLCFDCAWSEFESMNDELDPCYIIASPSTPSGGSGRRGMDLTDPDLLNDNGSIDPFAGGGGGGSPQNNNTRIPDDITKEAKSIFYNKFHAEPIDILYIEKTFCEIYKDCVGKSIINTVSKFDIKFTFVKGQPALAATKYKKENGIIELGINYNLSREIEIRVLFEEFFHCMQYISQRKNYTSGKTINKEVEAKMATFIFLEKYHPELVVEETNGWTKPFREYKKNKTQDNYLAIVNYIRTEDEHSAYTEKDFPDKEEFRDFDLMEEIFAKCDFETSLKPVSMK